MKAFQASLLLAAFAALAGTPPLQAQDLWFRAGAGAAVPVGGAAERRGAGLSAMLSVETQPSGPWSLRLDVEWSRLTGPPAPAGQEHFSKYQDLRILGSSLNGILRFPEDDLAPYLLAGIGAYRLQRVDAPPSPYGTTGALQVGVGLDGDLRGRVDPFVEARVMVHVTDYGSGEFSPTVYLPLLIGLRIR